jgi:hypothetical protein
MFAVLLWRWPTMTPGADADGEWAIGLSDDVEVLELEADTGYASFVSYSPEGGAAMIWIFEDQEGEEAPS